MIGHDLDAIVDGVVPELQRRDAFRTDYDDGLFRERLGLPRPVSRYATAGDPGAIEDTMSTKPLKQVILAAYFPGVNNTTVWHDPRSRSQIEFDSFVHLAQTAERGKLDFFFLAEGLRLREQGGKIHDLDTVGRPDSLDGAHRARRRSPPTSASPATLNATFHEPYELARQLATLDHLSGGRAAWNVVTSSDAFTGENFRRGGFLDYEDRYERAGEFVQTARELWDSWADDELVVDAEAGQFVRHGSPGSFDHQGPQFDIRGNFNVPRSPQRSPGHPAGRRQRRRT